MGKGKGMVDYYYARVKANRVVFEVSGIPKQVAKEVFRKAGSKFPVKTRMIEREPVPRRADVVKEEPFDFLAALKRARTIKCPSPLPPSSSAPTSTPSTVAAPPS